MRTKIATSNVALLHLFHSGHKIPHCRAFNSGLSPFTYTIKNKLTTLPISLRTMSSLNSGSTFWDARYSQAEFIYGTEPNDFLRDIVPTLNLQQKGKCLMLADGEGRNGVFMARQGLEVVSVDYAQAGLDKAQKIAKDSGVELETVLADLAEYDLGTEKWDCIVGIFCHLPPSIRNRVLTAIPGSLKSGGVCIFECYRPDQLEYKTGGPQDASMMYSKAIFEDAFAGKLKIQRNEELDRDVVEGNHHTGMGAVVQFIGKKE